MSQVDCLPLLAVLRLLPFLTTVMSYRHIYIVFLHSLQSFPAYLRSCFNLDVSTNLPTGSLIPGTQTPYNPGGTKCFIGSRTVFPTTTSTTSTPITTTTSVPSTGSASTSTTPT